LALDGGEDGLDFYRAIISKAPEYLKDKGCLAFEVGIYQANGVARLMSDSFKAIEIRKDLAGIDRVVAGFIGLLSRNTIHS
jgi:release factor glutamine methyltransferase